MVVNINGLKYKSVRVRPLRRKLTHMVTDPSVNRVRETNNDFCVFLHMVCMLLTNDKL